MGEQRAVALAPAASRCLDEEVVPGLGCGQKFLGGHNRKSHTWSCAKVPPLTWQQGCGFRNHWLPVGVMLRGVGLSAWLSPSVRCSAITRRQDFEGADH